MKSKGPRRGRAAWKGLFHPTLVLHGGMQGGQRAEVWRREEFCKSLSPASQSRADRQCSPKPPPPLHTPPQLAAFARNELENMERDVENGLI